MGVCIGKSNCRYFFAFVAVLPCLSASISAISLAMIFQLLHDYPLQQYLIEILLAATASFLFFPIFKLFTYHLQLFHNRQTTNEDLKGLYHILQEPVPFELCELHPRPSLVPLKDKMMILNVQKEEYQASISSDRRVEKGQRYSTLVSDHQSVLNYLVVAQL